MNVQDVISYRVAWVGLLAGVVFALLDALINANSMAQQVYAAYRPIMRASVNAPLGVAFDRVSGIIMAALFMALTPALPTGWVGRGVAFGVIAWFFRVVMGAASQTVMFEVPITAALYAIVTGLGEMVCLGLLYGSLLRHR